jgi:acyl carrier protein
MSESESEIEAFVLGCLAANRGVDVEDVRASVAAAGIIDSLEGVEILLSAEERYDVSIPEDALTPQLCRSIPDLIRMIRSKLAA